MPRSRPSPPKVSLPSVFTRGHKKAGRSLGHRLFYFKLTPNLLPNLLIVAALLLSLAAPLHSAARGAENETAELEILALIDAVKNSDCDFVRNGDRHNATDAADHLRLKYRRGRRYADTAEHFIDRLASKSSWSGKPYYIECEGERRPSGEWLHDALRELRS